MAAYDVFINRQLFHELKQQYPEVPDGVVTDYMIQHSNNKNKCIQVLAVESPKHMFGEYSRAATSSTPNHQLADLDRMDSPDSRLRNDSGSSSKSNASTGSSTSQTLGHVASVAMAWPPTNNNPGSPVSSSADSSPVPAQADLSQFLGQGQTPGQIPNISCDSKIQMPSPHGQSTGSPSAVNSQWLPAQRGYHSADTNPHSVNTAFREFNLSGLSHNNNIHVSTAGQYVMGRQGAGPVINVPQPQAPHLSKATIFIKNPRSEESQPLNPFVMPRIPFQSPIQINQPISTYQGSRIPVHHFTSQEQGPSLVNRQTTPYVVHYNLPPKIPSHLQVSVSPTSSAGGIDISSATNPPNMVNSPIFNPPDVPPRRDVMPSPTIATVSYPVYPTFNSVPTLPQMSPAGSPQTNTPVKGPFPVTATMYPVNVNSIGRPERAESPLRDGRTKRNGNVQEEKDYIQALLSHQHVRKDKLHTDLEKETTKLEQIRDQVLELEKNTSDNSNAQITVEALAKLRDSNRKLLIDIQSMTREIDMYQQGNTPLGAWNPEDEQFYSQLDQVHPPATIGGPPVPRRPNPHRPVVTGRFSPHSQSPHSNSPTPPPRLPKYPPVRPPQPNITFPVPAPPPQPHSSSGDSEEGEQWSCSTCTYLNHPALNKCECCEMPRVNVPGSPSRWSNSDVF